MKIKAISLVSGGLDSTLATALVHQQGIEVMAVRFLTSFGCGKKKTIPDTDLFLEKLGILVKNVDISQDFLELVKSPAHGFGSHMNPCIDCKIFMLKKAKQMMKDLGASFLVTGEVVGQRPMSQKMDTLRHIEKQADAIGLIVRPLSAQLLPLTTAEEKGWVDRAKFLNISGRGRKIQMQLATDLNIGEYPNPAGGCLLTDPQFARRVKDLVDHQELTLENAELLKHGRYFRLTPKARLIVGRDERDVQALESLRTSGDVFFSPKEEVAGASGLGGGDFSQKETIVLAARIVARYFDKKDTQEKMHVVVEYNGKEETIEVESFSDEEAKKYLI